MRSATPTMFEVSEQWMSPLPQSAVLKALAAAFEGDGAHIRREDDRAEARLGSSWRYRFWGKRFAAGRARVPVAVEFRTTITPLGTSIAARAYDMSGGRHTNRSPSGAEESVANRVEELLGKAAASLGVERPA